MITIPVQLSNELAQRVMPLKDRLPEIIELGLRQIESDAETRGRLFAGQAAGVGRDGLDGHCHLAESGGAACATGPPHADQGGGTTGQRADDRRAARGAMNEPADQAVTSYLDSGSAGQTLPGRNRHALGAGVVR